MSYPVDICQLYLFMKTKALSCPQDYVGRTWAFSVLVLACVGVMAALYVAVYVALRVCDGTLTGPQVRNINC